MVPVSPFTAIRAGYFAYRFGQEYYNETLGRKDASAENRAGSEPEQVGKPEEQTNGAESVHGASARNANSGIDWEALRTSAEFQARAIGNAGYRAAVDTVELNISKEVKDFVDRRFGGGENSAGTEAQRYKETWKEGSFVNDQAGFQEQLRSEQKVTVSYLDQGRDAINSLWEKSKAMVQKGREQLDSAITSARAYLQSLSRDREEKPDYSTRSMEGMFVDPHESIDAVPTNLDRDENNRAARKEFETASEPEIDIESGDILEEIDLNDPVGYDERADRSRSFNV
ncbi:MAG: hypothetical protein AAFX98_03865 [Pseudomonadota bacterium]